MRTAMLTRLARRRLEAAAMISVAAISATGLLLRSRGEDPAPAAVATYVAAAVAPLAPAKSLETGATSGSSATPASLAKIENPRVDSWIHRFTTDLRSSFATQLDRMASYSDMIVGKLDDRGMPRDLIYLAMIESGFDPTAHSPAHAKGMWQFMSPTARRFGLQVGRHVDQRTDPVKSTDAALTYLAQLKNRFGSWYLAAAAYNSGEGTVRNALRKVTGRTTGTDADFYRIAPKLPKETRDYVPKLVAAARIGRDPGRYGFSAN